MLASKRFHNWCSSLCLPVKGDCCWAASFCITAHTIFPESIFSFTTTCSSSLSVPYGRAVFQVFADGLSVVAYVSHHQTVSNYFRVELPVLKETTKALAALLGLTLPVPFERQAHKTAGYQLRPEPRFSTSLGELVGSSC